MHHIICHVFFGFFIILGICDIIIFLISKFFKIADAKLYTFFIPIKGHMEDIEFIIRSMMFRFRFLHPFLNFKIILIDNGIDDETRIICHNLCKIYHNKLNIVKNQND